MPHGAHAKDPDGSWAREAAVRAALVAALLAVGAAVFLTAAGFAVLRELLTLTGSGIHAGWRRLGHRGRQIAGMAATVLAVTGASDAGIIPDNSLVKLVGAGAVVAFFWWWMIIERWRGQRAWREHGPVVVDGGGWREHERQIGHNSDRLDAMEAEVRLLTRAVGAICEGGGITPPGRQRHLRAVGDGTGPQPRIS